MNIQHLRYFKVVAERENMRKAAEELMIAQSALSRSISALESEVGVNFFVRAKQRISLNNYGRRFYYTACEILELLDDTLKTLDNDAHFSKIPIRFWVLSPSTLFCSRMLIEYSLKNPAVQINMIKHHSQVFDIEDYDILLFSQDHTNCEKFIPDSIPVISERIGLAVNASNPLANKPFVTREDILREKFIVPSSLFISRVIKELNLETNPQFLNNIVARSNSPLAIRTFLESMPVVSFAPEKTWCLSDVPNLNLLPIKDYDLNRTLYLHINTQNKHGKKKVTEDFAKFVVEYTAKM